MNWLSTQLKSPSTHNALASIAAALTALSAAGVVDIPPTWFAVATAVFAALGVKLPEAGETPAPKS